VEVAQMLMERPLVLLQDYASQFVQELTQTVMEIEQMDVKHADALLIVDQENVVQFQMVAEHLVEVVQEHVIMEFAQRLGVH
jgi:hypothetical protein